MSNLIAPPAPTQPARTDTDRCGLELSPDDLHNPPDEPDPLLQTAKEVFGIRYLMPYQRLVMSNVLEAAGVEASDRPQSTSNAAIDSARRRQIVILPTGAGKSLCFQLPSVLMPGVTIIVYPLLALMSDQKRRVDEAGLRSEVLRGGQSRVERNRIFTELKRGAVNQLIANPEVLCQRSILEKLTKVQVSCIVIDEAHCVSEWGESFRPTYLELGKVITTLAPPLAIAFTATASVRVLASIRTHLFGSSSCHLVEANPDRPNIAYSVIPCSSKSAILESLMRRVERPAIVFCSSRKRTEETARTLRTRLADDRIRFYHAGLEREEKEEVERWFFSADDAVLTATCAYGMGVDKANIRTVIHRDVPSSVEAYLQESGRGGRDRGRAEAILLVGTDDYARGRAAAPAPGPAARHGDRLRQMLEYTRSGGCRRDALLSLLGHHAESCFGCDNCRMRAAIDVDTSDASSESSPASILATSLGEPVSVARKLDRRVAEAILAMVAANPRYHRPAQLARLLCGRLTADDRQELRFGLRWLGSLPEPSVEAVEEAVVAMLAEKRLRRSSFLFGRTLRPGRDA